MFLFFPSRLQSLRLLTVTLNICTHYPFYPWGHYKYEVFSSTQDQFVVDYVNVSYYSTSVNSQMAQVIPGDILVWLRLMLLFPYVIFSFIYSAGCFAWLSKCQVQSLIEYYWTGSTSSVLWSYHGVLCWPSLEALACWNTVNPFLKITSSQVHSPDKMGSEVFIYSVWNFCQRDFQGSRVIGRRVKSLCWGIWLEPGSIIRVGVPLRSCPTDDESSNDISSSLTLNHFLIHASKRLKENIQTTNLE